MMQVLGTLDMLNMSLFVAVLFMLLVFDCR